jgi:hypothetical protein
MTTTEQFNAVFGTHRGPLTEEARARRDEAINTYSALVKLVEVRAHYHDSDEVLQRLDKALQCAYAKAGGRPDDMKSNVPAYSRDALREVGLVLIGGRLTFTKPLETVNA